MITPDWHKPHSNRKRPRCSAPPTSVWLILDNVSWSLWFRTSRMGLNSPAWMECRDRVRQSCDPSGGRRTRTGLSPPPTTPGSAQPPRRSAGSSRCMCRVQCRGFKRSDRRGRKAPNPPALLREASFPAFGPRCGVAGPLTGVVVRRLRTLMARHWSAVSNRVQTATAAAEQIQHKTISNRSARCCGSWLTLTRGR